MNTNQAKSDHLKQIIDKSLCMYSKVTCEYDYKCLNTIHESEMFIIIITIIIIIIITDYEL